MLSFVIRRILLAIPVLFGLLVLTFIMVRLVPSDPAAVLAGDQATPQQIAALREQYGFDKPLLMQFVIYVGQILSGSLGVSYLTQQSVLAEIMQRIPATLELAVAAMGLATLIGIPLGLVAASHHNRFLDHLLRVSAIGGLAIASFWLALVLQFAFSMELDLLPVQGRLSPDLAPPPFVTGFYLIDSLVTLHFATFVDALRHIVLPAITLAVAPMATIMRFTRSAVLTTLRCEFVDYERAMGYPRRVLMWKYVLRNSLVTPVTQIGLLLGGVLAGAVVIEAIFDWPGLGSYAVLAIASTDYQATLGVVLVIGVFYAAINILVDVVHAIIDPRVREHI
ncbi:MAG TPA: ABC transporter permease [Beijerinckiaceae bacterium]|nr:ABC transporter permease [Beijerinckiaceae bacterium]